MHPKGCQYSKKDYIEINVAKLNFIIIYINFIGLTSVYIKLTTDFFNFPRFNVNGMPSLLEQPIPSLVHDVDTNPYDDPSNPPSDPDKIVGFCGIQWTNNTDPGKKFKV